MATQTQTQSRPIFNLSLRGVVALVCVLLVLLVGAAHLLHTHGPDQTSDPGCSLCAVVHLAAIASPSLDAPVALQSVVQARFAERVAVPRQLFIQHLYIRPPPEWNVFA